MICFILPYGLPYEFQKEVYINFYPPYQLSLHIFFLILQRFRYVIHLSEITEQQQQYQIVVTRVALISSVP